MHVTFSGNVGGTVWANTIWVRNGNAQLPTQADFTAWVAAAGLKFAQRMLVPLSNTLKMTDASALYYTAGGAQLAAASAFNSDGSANVGAMPANVSCCVGFRVQQHYRGGHPRMYLAGIPFSATQDSRLFTAAFASGIASRATDFHNDINALTQGAISNCKLGIVSFVLNKQWRSPPVFRDFIVNSSHCDQRIDSMRRRLGRDLPP